MQSKISFFNRMVYRKNLKNCIWIMLVYFICLMTRFFLLALEFASKKPDGTKLTDTFSSYGDALDSDIGLFIQALSSGFGYVLSALFVIAAVLFIFSYLYNSKTGYMMSAFPITRFELYTTGVLSGITVLTIPQFILFVCQMILGVSRGIDGAVGLSLYAFLCQLIVISFFVVFCSCVAMTSGQSLTVVIFYFVFNFCYSAICISFGILTNTICYGKSDSIDYAMHNVLTPMVYLTRNVGLTFDVETVGRYDFVLKFGYGSIAGLVGYAIATIVLFALGYFLYHKKHMETIHDFITVPVLRPVFKWCVSFFMSIVLASGFAALIEEVTSISFRTEVFVVLITTLVLGVLIFFGCQMLTVRSFRIFTKKFVGETEIFVGVILLLFVANAIDIFGYERKVPDASEVQYVQIYASDVAYLRDEDEISRFTEFHRELTDARGDLKKYVCRDDYDRIDIYYLLKNGDTVSRTYNLPVDREISDDYKTAYTTLEKLVSSTEFTLKHKIHMTSETKSCDNVHAICVSIDRFTPTTLSDGTKDWEIHEDCYDASDVADAIYRAYLADVKNGVFDGTFLLEGSREFNANRYAGTLSFQLVADNGEKIILDGQSEEIYYGGEYRVYEEVYTPIQTTYVSFGPDAKNTIAALMEYGIITSTDELVSNEYFDSL